MEKPSIIEVLERYLPLRKAGKEYIGACPFHPDKIPSLSVNEDKGVFHCFGCGESGDVFDFLMKLNGVSFGEAARSVGVEPGRMPERPKNDPIREQAVIVCAWANHCFDKVQSILRDVGQRMRVAGELKWQEETDRLTREWEILSDLSDDLQNPTQVMSLWAERESVEAILANAIPEPLPDFPPITPESRSYLQAVARGDV